MTGSSICSFCGGIFSTDNSDPVQTYRGQLSPTLRHVISGCHWTPEDQWQSWSYE